jgi:hypothetical protein
MTLDSHPEACPMSSPIFTDLNNSQAHGHACVVCGADLDAVPRVPVGRSATTGEEVGACTTPCAGLLPAYVPDVPDPGDQLELVLEQPEAAR